MLITIHSPQKDVQLQYLMVVDSIAGDMVDYTAILHF